MYEASTKSAQLAIFSEVYYPKGWNAYINNEPVDHLRANYVLRAIKVPAGNNKIEFKFEPRVIQTGSTISMVSSILLLLIVLGGLFAVFRNKKNEAVE